MRAGAVTRSSDVRGNRSRRVLSAGPERGARRRNELDRGVPGGAYNASVSATLSPTVPVRIHADRAARTLEIDWQDGHHTVYDFVPLRWLCPCAYCRGEAGMPGWLDSRPTLTEDQTRLVNLQLVGSYAVAPSWADGHHTGYYTFQALRDNCPCPECASRRVPRTDAPLPAGDHVAHAPDAADGGTAG